jgi:RNA polymerase subunit RPABC4/transcription elongation factor Spt4
VVLGQRDDSGVFEAVRDFFDSGTWPIARNVALFLLVVFWLAIAYWVFKDARRRIEDPWLVGMATILGLVPPFVGALVYMLFRPPEYLDDVRERELEMRAIEERLAMRNAVCPVCRAPVDESFLVCPVCTTKLRQACVSCKAPLEPLWQICPYCETPVEAPGEAIELPAMPTSPREQRRSE